jgi:hypothetical protein
MRGKNCKTFIAIVASRFVDFSMSFVAPKSLFSSQRQGFLVGKRKASLIEKFCRCAFADQRMRGNGRWTAG